MKMCTLVLALVVAGGCSDKQPPSRPPPAPAPAMDAPRVTACKQAVANLGTWIEALALEGDTVDVSPSKLASFKGPSTDPPDSASLIQIRLSPASVSSGGEDWGKPGDKQARKRLRDLVTAPAASPREAYELIIDHDTPWSAVVATLSALAPTRVRLMFERAEAAPPPGPSAIDADLDAFLAADAATRQSMQIATRVFARCAPAAAIWSRLTPGLVAHTLAGLGLAGAIEQCGCEVDLDAVRRMVWVSTGRARARPSARVTVSVASSSDGAVAVTAKADAVWSDAHQAVVDAARGGAAVFPVVKD